MAARRSGWAAGLGATVAGAAVFIAHQAGLFADDAARVLPKVGRAGGIGGGVVDVLRDPAVSGTLKQAVATFRDLRKGTDEEIVVARVGCAVMNSGVAGSLDQTGYEQQIRALLPAEYVQGPQSFVVDRYVDRAANALTVANANGGAGRWYLQYCVFRP